MSDIALIAMQTQKRVAGEDGNILYAPESGSTDSDVLSSALERGRLSELPSLVWAYR